MRQGLKVNLRAKGRVLAMAQGGSPVTGGAATGAGLVRNGGIAMVVAGVLVLFTIPLIPLIIPSLAPTSTAAGLQALQSEQIPYVVTWVLYLVSDVLFAVVFLALYRAIGSYRRNAMLAGLVLNSLFVAVDVALDIPLRLYLVVLSDQYASGSQVLAAAQSTVDASNLVALVATVFQFTAVILASYVMLKSGLFRKIISYVGVLCGVVALLFVPAFVGGGAMLAGIFNIGGFVLLVVWSIGAGVRLRKLANG